MLKKDKDAKAILDGDETFDDNEGEEFEDLDDLGLEDGDEESEGGESFIDTSQDNGKGKKDYKKLYQNAEKSRRHQQGFVSKLQKELKELTAKIDKSEQSEKVRNQKILEAFGYKDNVGDDEAKKLIAEYRENPVSFIKKMIQENLNAELPDIKDEIALNKMDRTVDSIKDDIESEYNVQFTPDFEKKVIAVLNNFSKSFKTNNPKQAVLQATIIASGGKIEKRGDNIIEMESDGRIRLKGAEKFKDAGSNIKKRIMSFTPSHKKVFK